VFFLKIFPKKVLYEGFSEKSDEAFDDFMNKRLKNPAKKQALDWLVKDTLLNEKFSLLDLGCGPGVIPQMILQDSNLNNRVVYSGVDVSENALRYCRSRLPENYVILRLDFLNDELPKGCFDVIIINEVLEHLPSYEKLITAAIEKGPKILIITTFAVLHGLKRDRILWNSEKQCYMNSYSFEKFFQYLRDKVACPILLCDVDKLMYDRYWFPRKELMVWYMRLASPSMSYLNKK
jgi:SAM-dependent methyltransferase